MLMKNYVVPYRRALAIIRSKYTSFWLHFSMVCSLMAILSAIGAATPYFLRETTNALAGSTDSTFGMYAYAAGCAYAISWTIVNAMVWMKGIATAYVMTRCEAAFYDRLFHRVMNMPYVKQKTIDRGAAMLDFERAKSAFSLINHAVFWTLIPVVFELLLVFGILWNATNLAFSASFVCCMVILFYIAFNIAERSEQLHRERFYDIKINRAEEKEQRRLAPVLGRHTAALFNANYRMGMMVGFQMICIGMVLLGFTLYTIFNTVGGLFTIGDFVMVTSYTVQLTTPFILIAGSLINLKQSYVALNSGLKYFDAEQDDKDRPVSQVNQYNDELYRVEPLVSFSNKPMTDSFTIRKGKMYALCGPSGIGKTSLVNAMLGLDETNQYQIVFCGNDLKTCSSEHVMACVSVVPQHAFIFTASVRENLLYGIDAEITDDYLMKLVDQLELHSIADVGVGQALLDTQIGPHSKTLSGGESQRISIARAILRNKEMMILDEPTSGVDSVVEAKVLRFLRANVKTLLVVTHRQLAREMADEVIYFKPAVAIA
jgi:ATP-binding cassette subfamily B protein